MRQSQSGSEIALGGGGIAFRAATKFLGWHCLFGGAGLEDGFQCEHYGLAYVVSRIQCG